MNVEITPEGVVPAFDHGEMTGSVNPLHYFVTAIETKDSAGNPCQYVFVNTKCYIYKDGALALDITFSDVVQGAMIFGAVASSTVTKRLIAFFGNSTTGSLATGGHAWRNLGTASDGAGAGWSYHVGATAIQAWLSKNFGPDAMIVTGSAGTGRTGLAEWNIQKVVQGLYDGTTSNIGAVEPVGNGDWPIIGLAALRQSFIAGTGAGAFFRNTVDKIYEPIRPLQEQLPHGLSTKAMAASENGVIYAMNDGRLFEYGGNREAEITPLRGMGKPKDTQRGRASFVAHRGDVLAVGYEVGQSYISGPRAAAMGVRVFTRISGTWAASTSGVTDGSLVTPASANMNAWGGTNTDRLLVMSPFPLAGIIPRVTRNPNANTNSFTTPKGTSSGAETAGSLSVTLGNVVDNTILSVTGKSLVLTGMPPAAAEPLLWNDTINTYAAVSASSALTITGISGSPFSNMYAYEWNPTNTTAMTNTTTIDEIDVIIARPGLGLNDTSGPFTAANDFSSLAASGMLLEIYFGDPRGFGQYDWSNPYAIFTKGGGVWCAAWTAALTGALSNGGSGFNLYGRFGQYTIAEGQTRNPRMTRYPRLCQWTTTEPGPQLALNDIVFRESSGQVADPARQKRISKVMLYGEDIQPEDLLKPLVSYRQNRGWHKFPTVNGPSPLTSISDAPNSPKGGRKANLRVLISDGAQTDLWAPLLERVRITWDYTDDNAEAPAASVAVE